MVSDDLRSRLAAHPLLGEHEVIIHVSCCLLDVALCDGQPVDPPDKTLPDSDCVVCLDLEKHAHHLCPARPVCIQWEDEA